MGAITLISWTDSTWNFVTGCDEVGPECDHCYARTLSGRLRGMGNPSYVNGFDVTIHERVMALPFSWRGSREVFVNSMGDTFHREVPTETIRRAFGVMAAADWHFFQVLTKRAPRLRRVMEEIDGGPMNVGLGVSVGTAREGIPRIKHLRNAPAALRFLSVEPLLENLGELDLSGIHWVIVGGESGRVARPMAPAWARSIRDQCAKAGVAFHFKQWGAWLPLSQAASAERSGKPLEEVRRRLKNARTTEAHGERFAFVGKSMAGRVLDGQTHDARPLGSCGVLLEPYPGRAEVNRRRAACGL